MPSKKEIRRQKKEMKEKEEKRNNIIVLCIGLFFIILAIIGLINSTKRYKEYSNSDRILKAEGIVTYVERKEIITNKGTSREERINYWDATLDARIGEENYTFKKRFNSEVKKDDIRTFEVYQKSDGTYDIPESTTKGNLFLNQIIYYISLVIGLFLSGIAIFLLYDSKKGNNK